MGRRAGIGFAIARRLRVERLMVQLWAPHDAGQAWGADPEIEAALRAEFPGVEIVAADFMDPEAPARLVDAASERFGHLDILVANHAHSSDVPLGELTARSSTARWRSTCAPRCCSCRPSTLAMTAVRAVAWC